MILVKMGLFPGVVTELILAANTSLKQALALYPDYVNLAVRVTDIRINEIQLRTKNYHCVLLEDGDFVVIHYEKSK